VFGALKKRSYLAIVSGGIAAATAGVNALFQLVAARNLSESRYGELATAIAIVGVLGVAGSGVQMSTAHDIAESNEARQDNPARLKATLATEALVSALIFAITFSFLGLGLVSAALISLFVPTVILLSRANGEIHGRGMFVSLALFGLALSIGKVLLGSAALVLFASVKITLALQLGITLFGALLCLRRFDISARDSLTRFSSRLGSSVVLSALVWLIANLDILLSRLKFGGSVSGNIAVTSLFATVLLVVPSLVATVVYPIAVRRSSAGVSTKPLLLEAIGLSIIIPAAVVIVALQFENFLFDTLVGGSYELARDLFAIQLASYLPVAGIVGIAPLLLLRVQPRQLGLLALTVCIGSILLIGMPSSPRELVIGLVILHLVLLVEFLWMTSVAQPIRQGKSN